MRSAGENVAHGNLVLPNDMETLDAHPANTFRSWLLALKMAVRHGLIISKGSLQNTCVRVAARDHMRFD